MILTSELCPIGTAIKTHGLHGELSVELDADVDTEEISHVVMRIDGIFVPFRIAAQRPRGARGLLLTLAGVDSADEAALYTGHELYALRRELPDTSECDDDGEGLYADDLAGFTLTDPYGNTLGIIEVVDTTTINTLLHIEQPDGRTALVPLADEWICAVDAQARTISMDVPSQLLNL